MDVSTGDDGDQAALTNFILRTVLREARQVIKEHERCVPAAEEVGGVALLIDAKNDRVAKATR